MKKRKLVLALMLSLMMLVSMIPAVSFADGTGISTEGGALSEGTYTLSGDVDLTNNLTISAGEKVTIDLNGHTLRGNGSGSVIVVNGELTLNDSKADSQKNLSSGTEGVIQNDNGSWTVTYGVYDKDDTHTYRTYTAGAVVGGNATTGMAGGIHVNAGGSVIMNGGIVTGNNTCESDQYALGGGIFLADNKDGTGGSFTMNEGAISGNQAHSTVMQGSGAGVYVGQHSKFTMNGGVFSGNDSNGKTTSSAGAVYVQSTGAFSAKNSVFSGNSANLGGAFYASQAGTLSLTNCQLVENEAKANYGGAIAGGNVTGKKCVISHNKAVTTGGGIYLMNGADSFLTDCHIQHNVVSVPENNNSTEAAGGGGIATNLTGSTAVWNLTLNGCVIENNSVSVPNSSTPAIWGGGMKLEGPVKATITDTSVSNNKAHGNKVYGGGISTGNGTQVILNEETTISRNKAIGSIISSGGGIYMGANGIVTMNAGSIKQNEAGQGGGVTVGPGPEKITKFNMNGGTISGNKAMGDLPSGEGYAANVNTGGGVLITHWSYAECNLSGDAVIFNNMDKDGKPNNLCLHGNNAGIVARLTGDLTSGAHIGITKIAKEGTFPKVNDVIVKGTDSHTVTDADARYFTYDDSSKNFLIQKADDPDMHNKLILAAKENGKDYYTVTLDLPTDGSVVADCAPTTEIKADGTYRVSFTPKDGYEIESVTIDGKNQTLEEGTLTLENVNADKTIIIRTSARDIKVSGDYKVEGIYGQPVNYQIDAEGDVSYQSARTIIKSYALANGSSLPAGLTLSESGLVSGTPTETTSANGKSVSIVVTAANGKTDTIALAVIINKADQDVTYQTEKIEKHAGDKTFTNDLTKTTVDGAITYKSSDESVATVDETTGEVTIVGAGNAKIIATAAETENYKMAFTSYELTVTNHEFKDSWESDADNHWHSCAVEGCTVKSDEADHDFEWIIDKNATAAEKGTKHEECTVCHFQKDSVEIPAKGTAGGDQNANGSGTNADTSTNGTKTGDTMPIGLLAVLMMAAAAGIAFCGRKLYKSR